MVDLSTVLPYDYVRRPWALNNAIANKRLNKQNVLILWWICFFMKQVQWRFLDPFISTPIGLETLNDIRRGYTKNGKRIWGDLDDFLQKR